jgi:hypothetical protein
VDHKEDARHHEGDDVANQIEGHGRLMLQN